MINVEVIRTDLHNLPLRNVFDVIYSFGVLHHLSDPFEGFKSLVNFMKPSAWLVVCLYSKGMTGDLWYVKQIRRITTKLPLHITYILSFLGALFVHLFTKVHKMHSKLFPFSHTSEYNFQKKHSIAFDAMTTPIIKHYSYKDLHHWIINTNTDEISGSLNQGGSGMGWVITIKKSQQTPFSKNQ